MVYLLSILLFIGFSFATSIEQLKAKAEKGELSEEEYYEYVKYGLCSPLKDNFWEDRERGWLFGEFCSKEYLTRNYKPSKKKQEQAKQKKKTEKVIGMTGTGGIIVQFNIDRKRVRDDKYLSSLDAKKLRYLYQELLDEISVNPTVENIKDFLYVQDFISRRSLKVARVWEQVVLSDEKLSPAGKFKGNPWEEKILAVEMRKDREKFFKSIKDKIGLFVFVSGNCSYCHAEMEVIHDLILLYSLPVRVISRDFCPQNFINCRVVPQMFEKFNVSITPTIVMVVEGKDNVYRFQVIGRGLTSIDLLIERMVYYYKYITEGKHIDDRTIIWGSKP